MRGTAHVRRLDAAREPSALAVLVGPSVVYPRRAHRDRPGPDRDLAGAPLAVADDQGVPLVVAFVAMCLQVRGDLGLQRRHEHPAGSLAGDLVEQGSPVHIILRRLAADDLQHGCRLLPAAWQEAAVDQAGGYAARVTGSTIHNFRSYLEIVGTLGPQDRSSLKKSSSVR